MSVKLLIGQLGQTVIGKYVEIDESLRGWRALGRHGPLRVVSAERPSFHGDAVFLPGMSRQWDVKPFVCVCESEEDAAEYIEKVRETIAAFNASRERRPVEKELTIHMTLCE